MGRGGSAGSRRGGGAAGLLEDMITKDDRDWLEIASNAPSGGKDDRPRSEGSIRSREPEKPGTAQSTASGEGFGEILTCRDVTFSTVLGFPTFY